MKRVVERSPAAIVWEIVFWSNQLVGNTNIQIWNPGLETSIETQLVRFRTIFKGIESQAVALMETLARSQHETNGTALWRKIERLVKVSTNETKRFLRFYIEISATSKVIRTDARLLGIINNINKESDYFLGILDSFAKESKHQHEQKRVTPPSSAVQKAWEICFWKNQEIGNTIIYTWKPTLGEKDVEKLLRFRAEFTAVKNVSQQLLESLLRKKDQADPFVERTVNKLAVVSLEQSKAFVAFLEKLLKRNETVLQDSILQALIQNLKSESDYFIGVITSLLRECVYKK
ncbi:hypothetical protein [Mechercharimyces sp. CAU 1602]|uniref:hypothetical protein n=1 Tax=Mechercharimyces sp. CAU 1602 TaxID=2973933 RepID=UPI002161AEF3|nr:hypothetical protein [Mechercharimyces sp. CAU 1602]MCS1351331.1 hypothetical protein [Mechercharimyces sp. CAU 1602]